MCKGSEAHFHGQHPQGMCWVTQAQHMEPNQVAVAARQQGSLSNTLEGGFGEAVFTIGNLLWVVKAYEKLNSPLELPTAGIPASKNYGSWCSSLLGGECHDLWRGGTAPVKQNPCLPRWLWQDQTLVNCTVALGKFHYFYLLEDSRYNAIFSMWFYPSTAVWWQGAIHGVPVRRHRTPLEVSAGTIHNWPCQKRHLQKTLWEGKELFHVKTFPICI